MPRSLLKRFRPETIREFRLASRQRQIDGDRAEEADRRTAAIYLWGYAAEMTLKAAYFSAFGFADTRVIAFGDLRDARNAGVNTFGLSYWEKGKYHDIRAWSELLVEYRSRPPGIAYAAQGFGGIVKKNGLLIATHWNETLRYHKNFVYRHEVETVKGATRWLMTNSEKL